VLRPIATALLGVGLCLIGGAFDSPSLYLPGVAIALVALVGTAWALLAASTARMTRQPPPSTVIEDEPFRVRTEAQLGWLPAPAGELGDPLLATRAAIAGRRRVTLEAMAVLPRRGNAVLEPSVLTVTDPLRICTRRLLGPESPPVLVLPRVDQVTAVGDGGAAGAGRRDGLGAGAGPAGSWRDDASDGLDLDGLRPYREGASASRIHWATLARRGEMMERRFVAERASAPLVVLDAAAPASPAALDAAVRATASLCVALARVDGVALLLPGDRRPIDIGHDLGAWHGVHKRLALVEAGPRPNLAGLGHAQSTLLWVTAADLASLPRELERLPIRARYLVAPALPSGAVPAFRVAGCSGAILDRPRGRAVA
jgi:uncharacterized protein (DUF58 family)